MANGRRCVLSTIWLAILYPPGMGVLRDGLSHENSNGTPLHGSYQERQKVQTRSEAGNLPSLLGTRRKEMKPDTTDILMERAKELHRDLFGSAVRERPVSQLEIKLMQKYLHEAFEAGRLYER